LSLILAPSLLLAALAWGIVATRIYVLCVTAPVDVVPLQAAIERQLHAGKSELARGLCRGLPEGWAARVAHALLEAEPGAARRAAFEEQTAVYRYEAQRSLHALQGLGRMALPLSLGSAMVVMSAAFADTHDVARVHAAVGTAWQCLVTGGLCTLFCRVSAAFLRRVAAERLREIRSISLACPADRHS